MTCDKPKEIFEEIGYRLRRFRLASGISLNDLRVAIGGLVSNQTLSKSEGLSECETRFFDINCLVEHNQSYPIIGGSHGRYYARVIVCSIHQATRC